MTQDTVTIGVQQIRAWFDLKPGPWPPDHYALLGLPPGEPDVDKIEQRVHECLIRVRSYQLSHPMLATDAMTQLAKAFDCLTDKERKKAYDAARFPHLPPPVRISSARMPTKIATDTAQTPAVAPPPSGEGPAEWQSEAAPPPVRAGTEQIETPPLAIPLGAPPAEPTVAEPAPAIQPPRKLVYLSPGDVQLGGARRELYDRLVWTRRIQRAWNRAGKYAHKPRRRLVKPAEATELARFLQSLDDLLMEMPGLLGQPGQVGYRVVALNSQEPVAEHFKALDDDHRIALALDWTAGRKLLEEYRYLLMEEVKRQRYLSVSERAASAVNAFLAANWMWIVLVLAAMGGLALLISYLV